MTTGKGKILQKSYSELVAQAIQRYIGAACRHWVDRPNEYLMISICGTMAECSKWLIRRLFSSYQAHIDTPN